MSLAAGTTRHRGDRPASAVEDEKIPIASEEPSVIGTSVASRQGVGDAHTNADHAARTVAEFASISEYRHPSHRTVRLFLTYAEANAVRLQVAQAPSRPAVSRLRRQADGSWSFTMCSHCLAGPEGDR